jgi:2-hydroxycyclohexanecarboxyl-CoA dehydrogenase
MNDEIIEPAIGARFEGMVALVTGAGQGIGEATAHRLAAEGAAVGVLDKNPDTTLAAVQDIWDAGGEAIGLTADVSLIEEVADCVTLLRAEFGSVDILVNNAGFDRPGPFLNVSLKDFRSVFGVHFMGTVNCCRVCAPYMIDNGNGRIVNVSSIYAKVGSKAESAYCSAKAGIIGLTKALAREWGRKGVRVNAVMPGLTDTPTIREFMAKKFRDAIIVDTPLGRAAHPAEIAAAIAFLASDDASFITGATLEVGGGWNM